MGKFLRQLILLTRKNLRVRFSHKCVTFCELFIPLFITASIGILISVSTYGHHGKISSSDLVEEEDSANTVEELYNCTNPDEFWKSDPYQCQTRHDFINDEENMESVKQLHVHYIVGDTVIGQDQNQLVDALMTAILGSNQRNESVKRNSSVNWIHSWMSEKDLEICVLQHQDLCKDIFAAVIITKIVDAVEEEKKFTIEYKIRLTDDDEMIGIFYTNRLFIDYNSDYFGMMREKIRTIYMSDSDKHTSWFPTHQRSKGFTSVQTFLDRGIMNYIKTKYRHENLDEVQISLVRMPYIQPEERASDVSRFASLLYSLLMSLTIFSLMRVNSEKYSGFKELLRMHGVTVRTQWMGWLFSSFIVYSIWTLLLTLFFCIPIAGGPNLLPLLDVNCIIYWLLLLLFTMSITTFSYLVSVFFERVWTAASVGLVVWIMLAVFMMITSAAFYRMRKWTAIALMLIPTVAFDFTMRFFIGGGGRFRTMGVEVFENIQLTTLHCLFMLLLDSCIYMTLAVYLDNVLPAKYGVRKPPLYFLRDIRKFFRKMVKGADYEEKQDDDEFSHGSVEMTSIISQELHQPFESDPEHLEAAIVIHNLRKQFRRNKKRAVDGLSAKMFTGEIYALCGFNAAGKSTTIGVLTGLHLPTDGVARIFDYDIRKDMEEIRKYVGLCPQHNLLYDEMSVLEQVAFFGSLKGLNEPRKKAEELLAWLDLTDKLHEKPGKLSGGQKRRVHLGIALIGDTKLAFLDEPTSGLDPETRRGVWDILSKLRGKVTVILTTHDMEEADVLGDRIGIMSEGKLICSGTPSFLKRYYGVGYNLKMSTVSSNCDPEKVHSLSREYVPNAKLNSISGQNPSTGPLDSISISLPTADLDLLKVADLMDALHNQKGQLGVENIGLSQSTMDEVFLKVGEAVHAVTVPISCDPSTNRVSGSRYVGSRLRWYRFTSLVYKRMLYFCSAPFTLLLLILFFSIILWMSLALLANAVNSSKQTDPPRVVSSSALSSYQSPIIILYDNEKVQMEGDHRNVSFAVSYLHQLHKSSSGDHGLVKVKEFPKNATFDKMMRNLQKSSLDDIHNYRQYFIAGASFNMSKTLQNITGFYSVYALHSAPLSVNMISQTLIKKSLGVDASIGVINHPFKRGQNYDHISPSRVANINLKLYYYIKCGSVMLLVVITSLLTGTAALLPTEERLNKGKQLQLMTGASPFLYWSSMFTWDFLFFSFINIIITIIYVLADYTSGNWIFTNNGAGAIIFLILELHSFAALWLCYLISWAPCVKTASDGFLLINKLAIIVGVLWNIIRHVLISMTYWEVRRQERDIFPTLIYYVTIASGYVSWIVPTYSLYLSMFKLATLSIPNSICNWFPQDVLELSCQTAGGSESNPTLFMQSCCENCQDNCFKPVSYFNTTPIVLHDDHETHNMVFDIVALLLSGFLNAGLLFALEYLIPNRNAKRHLENMSSSGSNESPENGRLHSVPSSNFSDEDVAYEAARVGDIVKDNALETANHALITHNLHLSFGELKAVNGLSFGVHRGECFGLLGVNASGKTSTFRILTGDIFPSQGSVYCGGLNLYLQRDSYLSSIGYCPQFDGIIGSLTGLQMVKLYGALRGIPPERLSEDAKTWLDKFGLLGSASKKCGKYSGGMKRRLSAAIALIGNPKMLLLDEPTTGVDPAFRRQFWTVIKEVRESGQSVLLTSHTMDECEALCTRLGIMVDGKFKCLGNIQHLKSKFGRGYILTMKLKRVREEDENERKEKVDILLEKVMEAFGRCRLQTKQKAFIQYQILNKSLWYSEIFRKMEEIRILPELIEVLEEYSVTETSLEDVFISFANKSERK